MSKTVKVLYLHTQFVRHKMPEELGVGSYVYFARTRTGKHRVTPARNIRLAVRGARNAGSEVLLVMDIGPDLDSKRFASSLAESMSDEDIAGIGKSPRSILFSYITAAVRSSVICGGNEQEKAQSILRGIAEARKSRVAIGN